MGPFECWKTLEGRSNSAPQRGKVLKGRNQSIQTKATTSIRKKSPANFDDSKDLAATRMMVQSHELLYFLWIFITTGEQCAKLMDDVV